MRYMNAVIKKYSDLFGEYKTSLDNLWKTNKDFAGSIALTLFLALAGIGETGCSASYQEIRDPRDKETITRNAGIGAPSDQHVTITEKINPQTGEKTTTYDIKNDAKDKRPWIPWGWGYTPGYVPYGYQLPDSRYYFPPTATAPWPSWNFWGPGLNGGTLYRLNELEEELRPDIEEGLVISGLESLTPGQYGTVLDLFKKHRMETRLDSQG